MIIFKLVLQELVYECELGANGYRWLSLLTVTNKVIILGGILRLGRSLEGGELF
jgi:hypothetical protein